MPRYPIKIMLMFSPSVAKQDSDEESVGDGESLGSIMGDLKAQMASIDSVSTQLESHVGDLYHRARKETVDWIHEPLKPKPHIAKWCGTHSLSSTPTIDEFTMACLEAAKNVDLETRIVTFHKEDAVILWRGKRRLTVFDMIASIPSLFE